MNGVNNCKIVLGVGSVGLTCGKFNETQARITQGGSWDYASHLKLHGGLSSEQDLKQLM